MARNGSARAVLVREPVEHRPIRSSRAGVDVVQDDLVEAEPLARASSAP